MARYIKANPKVAQYLRLEKDRNQVKDGNYLLWQADMLAFGRLTELPQILEQIGGIALQAHEARQEQDGTTVRELPTATDSRFVMEIEQPIESPETEGAEMQPEEEPTEAREVSASEAEAETEQESNNNEAETINEETEA